MSSRASLYSRVLRRETHSSRAGVAIAVSVVVMLALLWVAVESVVALLRGPALVASPTAAMTALAGLASISGPLLIGGGCVLGLIGILLMVVALLPGTRPRHRLGSERCAVVVDDNVIANAVVRRVSVDNGIDPRQVRARIGRTRIDVRVTPTSGVPIDREGVKEATVDEILAYNIRLRTRVSIANRGVFA